MTTPRLVDCSYERHALAILAILNEAITTSTALYEYTERPPASMRDWFDTKAECDFPVLGAENGAGTLLGFASYGTFRVRPAYKYTVEHSVYVHAAHRGRGVAKALMGALVTRAIAQQYHSLIGAIDAENPASIALHIGLGFRHAGTLHQVGFKFGRWLDLALYELLLPTPIAPRDG